jgi:hypothetical protein
MCRGLSAYPIHEDQGLLGVSIPSSLSHLYSDKNAPESGPLLSICLASSSVQDAVTVSVLLVLGLYQCTKLLLPPSPRGMILKMQISYTKRCSCVTQGVARDYRRAGYRYRGAEGGKVVAR